MQFAIIDTIKDLLTGSIWDKFKELIEPYALVNAIIFIALNLALVYPAMGHLANHPFIAALASASDVWKLVVATIVLFVFSYLINHLSTFSLDLASGEIFRDSVFIGALLKNRQKRVFQKLQIESKQKPESDDDRLRRDKAAFQLAYDFPVRESELGLNRLGNLLLNPSSYVAQQYGANMQLIWPIILKKLDDNNKTLKSIQGNWISLAFFTSLSGLLILVVIELIFITSLTGNAIDLVVIVALLAFAGLCYYASLEKARQWGRGMRHIFDAHAKEVFADLGMDALKDLTPASSDYKLRWVEVISWLAYGAVRADLYKPQQVWYKADPVPPAEEWPKLKHPEFLCVEAIPRFTSQEMFTTTVDNTHICLEKKVEYLFAITNISTGENPLSGNAAYLLIRDKDVTPPNIVHGNLSRLKEYAGPVKFEKVAVSGTRQPGKPAGVLFPLGNIPPGSSRVLTYSFDSVLARVSGDLKIAKVEIGRETKGDFIDIFPEEVTQELNTNLTVELLDDAPTALNSYIDVEPLLAGFHPPKGEMTKDERRAVWSFTLKPKCDKIRVRLRQTMDGDPHGSKNNERAGNPAVR